MAPARTLFSTVADLLEQRWVKVTLAVLIIVSVLPFPEVEERLRPLFLAVFGVELFVRATTVFRERARRGAIDVLFLGIDALVFVSFLPLEEWLDARGTTALVFVRVMRLLLLIRFGRELAQDIYSIVTRREQLQQFGLVTLAVGGLAFVSAVVLAQLKVPHDYTAIANDREGFLDQLWWSFRQIESVDNLVTHLHFEPLVSFFSMVLTIMGVFIVSFVIGLGSNIVDQVMRAERRRRVDYKEHSLVVGPVHASEILVREFVRIYDKNRHLRRVRPRELWQWLAHGGPTPRRHALPRMALLGVVDDPPDYLLDPMMRWVVYRQGDPSSPEALERVGAPRAKRVILLARPDAGPDADAVTVAELAALRAVNTDAHVFVEVEDSANRALVLDVGGPGTFPLEAPRFLGLFLCQHLVVPGVEVLYQDLLTADGAEFYTHVFVDEEDRAALARNAADEHLEFARMARCAYREHGVVLAGVLLGEGPLERQPGGLIPVDRLVQWVNPSTIPDDANGERIAALGGAPGRIPVATMRGLIAIAESYLPVRQYGRALASGRGSRGEVERTDETASAAAAVAAIRVSEPGPRRVLVVGYSTALPGLLAELARFVPGVEVMLAVGSRGEMSVAMGNRLESLGVGFHRRDQLPGARGRTANLEHGGRLTVFTHDASDLAGFAAECIVNMPPVEAAVFLSEPEGIDRDARTALRVLRFVRALEQGVVPKGERLHLLAEFVTVAKGERIQQHIQGRRCGFADESCLLLTLVSTERIKNYFMVHSAFVPGVTALYDELLSETGQEILKLEVPAPGPGESASARVSLDELRESLWAKHCIPIAVALAGGTVRLGPTPSEMFERRAITGLYCVADSARIAEWLGPAEQKRNTV